VAILARDRFLVKKACQSPKKCPAGRYGTPTLTYVKANFNVSNTAMPKRRGDCLKTFVMDFLTHLNLISVKKEIKRKNRKNDEAELLEEVKAIGL
jgi:hypothetical protein